jgi:hypothetical protein
MRPAALGAAERTLAARLLDEIGAEAFVLGEAA